MGDRPGAPGQGDDPRPGRLRDQHHRVDSADLLTAQDDRDFRGGGEHGEQVPEAAPPIALFGGRPDERHAFVAVEVTAVDEPSPDRLQVLGPSQTEVADPARLLVERDAPLLQRDPEQLLRGDVPGRRRGHDRLDEALVQQQQKGGGAQQLVSAVARKRRLRRCRPPSGAAEALQERGDGGRGVELDHPVEVADVDAELERGGRDDDAVPRLRECRLRSPPLVERPGEVGDERVDPGSRAVT